MKDKIYRIICPELKLRAFTATTSDITAKLSKIHNTTPNATVALGRTVTAAVLLANSVLKKNTRHSLSLKFTGEGPLREVHVQTDSDNNVRGYTACPDIDLRCDIGGISFSKAIGAGFITVLRDTGGERPYSSVIPLYHGEIAADTAYYLNISEQIPSAVILGLKLDDRGSILSSGGILIQRFPDTHENAINAVEKRIGGLSPELGEALYTGTAINDVLSSILDNNRIEILEEDNITHSCVCSRELIKNIFSGISPVEIKDMIEKDGGAEIKCTFCRKTYFLGAKELRTYLERN